jgi:hypothetical protein
MTDAELKWIKSSRSMGATACVEMAADDDSILIRHSRQPEVQIRYTAAEIRAFFEGVRNNEFDRLIGDT